MKCKTCGHHDTVHLGGVGLCGTVHGCDCNQFRKAPAVHDGLAMSIDHARATQDAEWLAGSEADTAERNLARAYLALTQRPVDILSDEWWEREVLPRMGES